MVPRDSPTPIASVGTDATTSKHQTVRMAELPERVEGPTFAARERHTSSRGLWWSFYHRTRAEAPLMGSLHPTVALFLSEGPDGCMRLRGSSRAPSQGDRWATVG